ncbi:hypothetical protein H6F44_10535 [Pseudanabaena sp. FACHB-1277]|uniref:Uncharacterized protein n=1 Tax=Pseudanabaena cinerea FACHB-1277 TaxID=2949581 RepID=A0A926UTS0_9CYAN|nr:hypothetical protein [Pseudanabaena cinerea]MBD2150553.1 hypothetical protein [Pseudanabaena cinerea FACHB-1277]
MNAAEQARNVELATKIATVVNLFKEIYPAAGSDLKPWLNNSDTRRLLDPDSIDIGFHFPGVSWRLKVRSILFQIRLYEDPVDQDLRAIGIEACGHDFKGERWRFSTVESWQFFGDKLPMEDGSEKLRQFCRQALEVFNNK